MIHLHNLYNLNSREGTIAEEIQEIFRQHPQGRHIILGDFNLHHPSWGGQEAEQDEEAEDLIYEMESRGMELVLPPGTITYSERSTSTIDLIWASGEIAGMVTRCGAASEFDVHSPPDSNNHPNWNGIGGASQGKKLEKDRFEATTRDCPKRNQPTLINIKSLPIRGVATIRK